jgi:hypothetical protein
VDVPATIVAVGGILTPIGVAIAYLWAKVETRFTTIEKHLAECERRDHRNTRALTLYETALTVVMDELERHNSTSPALAQARKLLHQLNAKAAALLGAAHAQDLAESEEEA